MLKKLLSRKLAVLLGAGAIVIIRPEVSLYATVLGCAYLACQAAVDIFGKGK